MEFTPIISSASICSVTFIVPISDDIFEPIWALFRLRLSKEELEKTVELDEMPDSYDDYVKNRAIVLRLLDLGIIEKVTPTNSNDIWLCHPIFKFKKNDLEEMRNIVYQGGSSHDDEHFTERLEDGELKAIFHFKLFQ